MVCENYIEDAQQLTAAKKNAEFLQVANAFLKVRSAQHFLHLRLSSVHLIKFFGYDSFVLLNSALLLAANRYRAL